MFNELYALGDTIDWVRQRFGTESILVMGDLNADCDYLDDEDQNDFPMLGQGF